MVTLQVNRFRDLICLRGWRGWSSQHQDGSMGRLRDELFIRPAKYSTYQPYVGHDLVLENDVSCVFFKEEIEKWKWNEEVLAETTSFGLIPEPETDLNAGCFWRPHTGSVLCRYAVSTVNQMLFQWLLTRQYYQTFCFTREPRGQWLFITNPISYGTRRYSVALLNVLQMPLILQNIASIFLYDEKQTRIANNVTDILWKLVLWL